MYQYDDPTAAASLPASTAEGTAGYFTDGSPGSGQAATILRAEFMNTVMMEILNAVTGAGITPSKETHTQLRDAMKKYIDMALVGSVYYFASSTAPTGFLKANGAAISRTTYSTLFTAIGTTFGSGDGSTTFNVPDLRGEFLRGWDDGRGVDSGRVFGAAQTQGLLSHTHSLSGQLQLFSPAAGSGQYTLHAGVGSGYSSTFTQNTGGTETRPRNIALLACIKF